jgi:hypothetical protein
MSAATRDRLDDISMCVLFWVFFTLPVLAGVLR